MLEWQLANTVEPRLEAMVNDARGKPLLTVAEVAEYLAVPVRTLYSWRARGEGPVGIRVGRHLRYRHQAVEEYLERHTQTREGLDEP